MKTERPVFDISTMLEKTIETAEETGVSFEDDFTRKRLGHIRKEGRDDDLRDSPSPTAGGENYSGPIPPKEDIPEDAINPSHYRRHPSGIECIEVTRHMNFNTGNAVKYIWRYMDKGDPIENLQKAQWYLDDEIRRLKGLR
jgi:Protein of unknwon function (DUF3310)